MTRQETTSMAARGKWRGVLLELGVPEASLRGKKTQHVVCPLCQSDNFRFDDKDGRGTWICTCDSGDGMDLAMKYTGRQFRDVASQIDQLLGHVKVDPVAPRMTDHDRRTMLAEAWRATQPIQPGDLAHRYLESRCIEELIYPKALRFAPKMRDGEGGIRPCMVAMVGVYGAGKFSSMHRTFLKPDGSGKAEMESPRKLMAGELPEGACVALSDYHGGPLGIAEGIETAMSASAMYEMPVWSAINSSLLAKWIPPQGCDDVAIFGDRDRKFGGEAAAYTLAHRLAVKGINVTVHIPDQVGEDFNDIHMAQMGRKAKKC